MGPGLFMNNLHLAVQFFLQLAVILLACRVVGAIAARFGQPQVVAEMITGVCLGPSLFGALAPEWRHHRLIVDENGKRLAKRDEARSVRSLREAGWGVGEVLGALGAPEMGDGR